MKKRIGILCFSAVFLGSVTVGWSQAYFTDQDSRMNTLSFTGGESLDAVLTEPSWDPEQGLLVVPGNVIPKDPQITNTSSQDLDELAAVRVEFLYSENCPDKDLRGTLLTASDMAYVMDICTIDYSADIGGSWIRFAGEDAMDPVQHFYYQEILERNYPSPGATTEPLFTSLSMDRYASNTRYSPVRAIGGFDIRVTGNVIQQMSGESYWGLGSPYEAYKAGLFQFPQAAAAVKQE